MRKIAILVDGGFYRKRAKILLGEKSAADRAAELEKYCRRHIEDSSSLDGDAELYRVFYYDCPPATKKFFHPLHKKQMDFSKSTLYTWMNDFLQELKRRRKFALRMGRLSEEHGNYILTPEAVKLLCNGKMTIADLTDDHFHIDFTQKGVDMKIGIDIASMAYKKQVDQIILVSGDSDFVSVAKLARREGIDFILDPMKATIHEDLFEHIDGMRTQVDYISRLARY